MEPNRDVIIVHAGVGRRSERNLKAISKLCEAAVQNARAKAAETRSATEAVVEAIQSLEKSPLTNAGIGSNVNRRGLVECDASICEGHTGKGGSVGAVPSVPHPILIAHKMLTQKGSPACLYGTEALTWFRENGGQMPEAEVVTRTQRKMFEKYAPLLGTAAQQSHMDDVPVTGEVDQEEECCREQLRLDTVGAVALVDGNISAGVSSGGTFLKPPGRIGQAGVYGTGCFANENVGVSISGTGELVIRTALASRCVSELSDTVSSSTDYDNDHTPPAMELKQFLERCFLKSPCVREAGLNEMNAGIIGIIHSDDDCDLVWAHSSENFILAYGVSNNKIVSRTCSQKENDDVNKIRVFASGEQVRFSPRPSQKASPQLSSSSLT